MMQSDTWPTFSESFETVSASFCSVNNRRKADQLCITRQAERVRPARGSTYFGCAHRHMWVYAETKCPHQQRTTDTTTHADAQTTFGLTTKPFGLMSELGGVHAWVCVPSLGFNIGGVRSRHFVAATGLFFHNQGQARSWTWRRSGRQGRDHGRDVTLGMKSVNCWTNERTTSTRTHRGLSFQWDRIAKSVLSAKFSHNKQKIATMMAGAGSQTSSQLHSKFLREESTLPSSGRQHWRWCTSRRLVCNQSKTNSGQVVRATCQRSWNTSTSFGVYPNKLFLHDANLSPNREGLQALHPGPQGKSELCVH